MVLATWFQDTFGFASRLNAVVAGVALAFAIIPVIFTLSEEALTRRAAQLRRGVAGAGRRALADALRVVLPAAAPGIAAACVLGFGRAIGETMIVLMASGNAAIVSGSFADSVRTIVGDDRRRDGRGGGRQRALHRAVLHRHAAVRRHLRASTPSATGRSAGMKRKLGSAA